MGNVKEVACKQLKLKLHINKWVKDISNFDESFIKSYKEESGKRCSKSWKLYNFSQWFTLFAWKNQNWKSQNLVVNLYDKEEYVIQIRNLKQALNHGLVLKEGKESY